MAGLVIQVGSRSAQGLRPNNEDSYVADHSHGIYVVADGMGGQERGEQASGLACQIIPQVVQDRLAAHDDATQALRRALADANQAIIQAGVDQPVGRRMGTTAVVAVQQDGQIYVAGLGDSRAVLIRDGKVEQLTIDHSVAQALVVNGVLTQEEARHSPWQHVLHKFLGCAEMTSSPDVRPFTPQAGDRLLLATDGLTNYVFDEDLRQGAHRCPDPQVWANYLVDLALQRGSRDNVTCIVVAF
jgi:serine/threonine protein phosphatase PrpC